MTDEDLQHLRRLLDETRKRHNELEIQAARYGPARVPAETAIELRETEESMKRLEAKLLQVSVPMAVQEATGPEASIDVLRHAVKHLGDQVGTMWRWTEGVLIEMREESRVWREQQTTERKFGIRERRLIELLLAIGVMMAIYLAVRS